MMMNTVLDVMSVQVDVTAQIEAQNYTLKVQHYDATCRPYT